LAALASEPVVADCDVDAPNLHLLLGPKVQDTEEFIAANVAVIDPTLCRACGACELNCRFGAIGSDFVVDSIMCEGCGVCEVSCPYNAIQMQERLSGYVYSSKTRFGPMAHALLLAGESNSGKMVTRVRELARNLAETTENELILIDGPPGIACAAIAAITGSSAGLVVTEPTVPAIHDMKRVLSLFQHFSIPVMVAINKADLNPRKSKDIESFCEKKDIPVVGQLPYDPIMYKAVVAGQPIIEYNPNHQLSTDLESLWERVVQQLNRISRST
jgi:MinD superfamily P-loop ATPase